MTAKSVLSDGVDLLFDEFSDAVRSVIYHRYTGDDSDYDADAGTESPTETTHNIDVLESQFTTEEIASSVRPELGEQVQPEDTRLLIKGSSISFEPTLDDWIIDGSKKFTIIHKSADLYRLLWVLHVR